MATPLWVATLVVTGDSQASAVVQKPLVPCSQIVHIHQPKSGGDSLNSFLRMQRCKRAAHAEAARTHPAEALFLLPLPGTGCHAFGTSAGWPTARYSRSPTTSSSLRGCGASSPASGRCATPVAAIRGRHASGRLPLTPCPGVPCWTCCADDYGADALHRPGACRPAAKVGSRVAAMQARHGDAPPPAGGAAGVGLFLPQNKGGAARGRRGARLVPPDRARRHSSLRGFQPLTPAPDPTRIVLRRAASSTSSGARHTPEARGP